MKLFLATLALWGASSFAASGVYCKGWVYNDKSDKYSETDLTQASYDANFLEGNVLNYGLGADKFFLKDSKSLTLVIVDNKTHASAASTGGWKQINKTLMQEVNLFAMLPDGSRDQVQVSCYQDL